LQSKKRSGRKSIFSLSELPRTKEVRDLYWILKGPGLLNPDYPGFSDKLLRDEWFQQYARQAEAWFRQWDAHPEAFLDDLRTRVTPSTLLGRYFEALLSFWIRDYLKPTIFHAGVPVHERESSKVGQGRRTIGEFDFLFQLQEEVGQTPEARHWEASVKFYLFSGENAEQARQMNSYHGTYLRDRLDIKVHRIFEHQLKLGEAQDAQCLLERFGLAKPHSKAWVKGMLFYPSQSDWRNHEHPPEISPHHSRGWWTEAGSLEVSAQSATDRWVLLPKNRWLSPATIRPEIDVEQKLFTCDEMKEFCRTHFAEHLSPLMWAGVSFDSTAQAWLEITRGLVVHAGWLSKARQATA
jgi:hypothetical protein